MKTIQELEKLTDDELRVMLAELAGEVPVKNWRWFYDKERLHSAIYLDQEQAVKSRTRYLEEPFNGYETPSEPEEFDSWHLAPNYPDDLNACHAVESRLAYEWDGLNYVDNLESACNAENDPDIRDLSKKGQLQIATTTARQRTIALILTLQQP